MHIFVTGATGFVGTATIAHLLAGGHTVTGLARSESSASKLHAVGAQVRQGDLSDTAALAEGARTADAVIHLAFIHDFTRMDVSVAADSQAIGTLGQALAGSNKPLIVTSGLALLTPGRTATETDEPRAIPGHGRQSEQSAVAFADQGVRVGIVRLAPSVHGHNDHGFVPTLIDIARAKGISAYVDAGDNGWSAVHVDDAADLYRRALDLPAGVTRFHAAGDESVSFRDIAGVIGRKLGVPVQSIPADQAMAHFGWMGMFAPLDMSATSQATRERTGWQPKGPGLLEDLEAGTYFDEGQGGIS